MHLIVKSDSLAVHEDCNFSSKVVHTLYQNDYIDRIGNIGAWVKIKYKNDLTGWVYPYNSKYGFCFIDKDLITEEKYIKGSVCYIQSNCDDGVTYIDKSNKPFTVKNEKSTNLLFSVESEASGGYVYIKNSKNNKIYQVAKKDIKILKENKSFKYYSVTTEDLMDMDVSTVNEMKDKQAQEQEKKEEKKQEEIDKGGDKKKQEGRPLSEYFTSWWDGSQSKSKMDELHKAVEQFYSKNKGTMKDGTRLIKMDLNNLRSIFGMPYQYLPIADLRVGTNDSYTLGKDMDFDLSKSPLTDNKSIGVKYREKILSRMPFCIFMPGLVDFMPNYSIAEKEKMTAEIINASDAYGGNLKDLMDSGRSSYYGFYPAYSLYYRYVDSICQMAAVFMGLGDVKIPSGDGQVSLQNYHWQNLAADQISDSVFYRGSILYYLNTENQISENFSNATTQSQLANKTNAVSDSARELMFLSNTSSDIIGTLMNGLGSVGAGIGGITTEIQNKLKQKMGNSMQSSKGVINALLNGIGNTMTGAKMTFPELWQDSQFSRDFSITVKFSSPDNDPLSVYLNIIVPLIHTICLAAPKYTGPTTYTAPFLVRAFYQGFFNINMGIITDLSINKGNEGAWTYDNIPTTVELRITIKDLFATNFMSMGQNENNLEVNLLSNQPFVDYIANMCGINIDEPDIGRAAKMIWMLVNPMKKVENSVRSAREAMFQMSNQAYRDVYSKVISGRVPDLTDLAIMAGSEGAKYAYNKVTK